MTLRSARRLRLRAPLSELDDAVMQVVWTDAPCSVEAVHRVVSKTRDLKETTVRTVLRRLEQKGYVRHEAHGRAYVYSPVEPRRRVAARAVRQIIDRLCHGSVEELVSGMVDAQVLSPQELKQIEHLVKSHQKRGE